MKHIRIKFCLLLTRVSVLSLLLTLCLTTVYAKQLTVTGRVLDEFGETAIGVSILERGTMNGVITNVEGNFSITVSDGQSAVLQFSYVGYNTVEVAVSGNNFIEVTLEPAVSNIDEVVVIGYGTQTRREITGSVAQLGEEDFNRGVVRDASDLLQGRIAGLVITTGSGDVTREGQIRLRGTSTLQNDQGPFIVIDGVPGGDLSTVAPDDIESISVLKDASSAAIYGSRAAGGVILITTKRGSGMRTQVSYNGYAAVDMMRNKPDMMNRQQWLDYARHSGQDPAPYDMYNNADTDWFDEVTRTGFTHNHSLSLSGGGTRNNYRASFTYMDRQGIVRDNELQRMTFRLQVQQRALKDKLRLGITASTTTNDNRTINNDIFVYAYNMLPVYPVFNPDGSYFTDKNNEFDQANPVQIQDLNERRNIGLNYFGVGDIQFTIIDGLNIRTNLYMSRNNNEYRQFDHSETRPGMGSSGFAQRSNRINERRVMEWILDYERAYGDHKVQGLVGYSWEENMTTNFMARNRSFLINDLSFHNLEAGMGLTNGDVTSNASSFKLISMFGRAHYGFMDRYMITATLRRDGSSKFGVNHRWGWFPSAAVAWGISQEDFMQPVTWVNDLKLRVGYGVTGNQDGLQPYRSLAAYTTDGIYYDNGTWAAAYRISRNPNPDLKWEATAMFNVGLDFIMFSNRISGTIEFYDRNTTDMLYTYSVPTPPFVFGTMQANVGDMNNRGIELLINAAAYRTRDFRWNINFNVAHNKNKITRLSNDIYTTTRTYVGDPWIRGGSNITSHVVEEGYPVGQFFLLKTDGLTADGKYNFIDVDNDGIITENDRDYAGDAQPKLTFGLTNSFNYRQWDFSFFFRGSLGQMGLNNPRAAYATGTFLIGSNAMNDPLVYDLTESPRISDFYLENASFVRLSNVSLGYTVRLNNRDWIERMRFYVAGQDLFVITGYSGLDPELELFRGAASATNAGLFPGIEPRQFVPRARTVTFGVNLTF